MDASVENGYCAVCGKRFGEREWIAACYVCKPTRWMCRRWTG